jgi:broad specificity phosphatase PhoE
MFLYIVRHAQSLGNIQQHRTPDDGLSPWGQQQAECIPAAFEGIPVSVIFCSPFRRVIETATPLARVKGLRLTLVPELSEIFDSEERRDHPWESSEQLEASHPHASFISRQRSGDRWWPVWPEREEVEVRHRIQRFYESDIRPLLCTNAHAVVVGHGATTAQLTDLLENGAVKRAHANAVVHAYELEREGKVVCSRVTTEHLSPLKQASDQAQS